MSLTDINVNYWSLWFRNVNYNDLKELQQTNDYGGLIKNT